MTNKEFAASLGFTPEYLYRVRKQRTPNRELAEKLAAQFGGKAEDYWRPPGQRGRPRAEILPFRQFVKEADTDDVETNPCSQLIVTMGLHYTGHRAPPPPEDFDSLEALLNFSRLNKIGTDIESRDAALLAWRLFKVWRARKVVDEIVFNIEMGDDVDDEIIRALLSLCQRANVT